MHRPAPAGLAVPLWLPVLPWCSKPAAAGITGNTLRSLQVALAMFAVTGALLTVRLCRMTRKGERLPAGASPPEMRGH